MVAFDEFILVLSDFFLVTCNFYYYLTGTIEKIPLKKQHRKAVKNVPKSCMEEYIRQAIPGFGLHHIEGDHHAKMMDIYHEKKHLLLRLESLIVLQVRIPTQINGQDS